MNHVLQAVLRDEPGVFVCVTPNPFAHAPYNERPWIVRLYDGDAFDLDVDAIDFLTAEEALDWAAREYRVPAGAWMSAERPGSVHTLASIIGDVCEPPLSLEQARAACRLAYWHRALDEHGLTIWPSLLASLTSFRTITYEFLRELGLEWHYDEGVDAILDDALESTDTFVDMKAGVTKAARVSAWLPSFPDPEWPTSVPAGPLTPLLDELKKDREQKVLRSLLKGDWIHALGLSDTARVLRAWRRSRPGHATSVTLAGDVLLCAFDDDTPRVEIYATSTDGVLRRAAERTGHGLVTEMPAEKARTTFEREKLDWLAWIAKPAFNRD